MNKMTSILFVGDLVGGIGKRTLLALLPSLRERYALDFVVVNVVDDQQPRKGSYWQIV